MLASLFSTLFIALFWAIVIVSFILSFEIRKLYRIIDQGNDQWAKKNKEGSIKEALWDTRKNKDKSKTPYKKEKDYIQAKMPSIFALRRLFMELFVALLLVIFVIVILHARIEPDSTFHHEPRTEEAVAKDETGL